MNGEPCSAAGACTSASDRPSDHASQTFQALVVAATLIAGVIVIGIAATQTAVQEPAARLHHAEAHQYLNGELSIGRLGGNLFFGIEPKTSA